MSWERDGWGDWRWVVPVAELKDGPAPPFDLSLLEWKIGCPANRAVLYFIPIPNLVYVCEHGRAVSSPLCPEPDCGAKAKYRYAR